MKLALHMQTATLVMACCAVAHAQSRSHVDVEFGGWTLSRWPGFVMGATGWMGDHSGVAVRGVFVPGSVTYADSWGFETQYRHRRFVRNVEIDLGIGLMFVNLGDYFESGRWRRRGWLTMEQMELLVGPRFPGRFSVKAGLGCHSAGFLQRDSEDIYIDLTVKLMATVSLGRRR